jgi:hypothetical protein
MLRGLGHFFPSFWYPRRRKKCKTRHVNKSEGLGCLLLLERERERERERENRGRKRLVQRTG